MVIEYETDSGDNLTNRPGYIAGVCNPAFADRPSWWDVLCNIETGKITVSKDLRPPAAGIQSALRAMKLDGGIGGDDGGGTTKEKEKEKGDKGDNADNLFMEEVSHSFPHSRSLIIAADLDRFAEIDPSRYSSSLWRIGHSSSFHRIRGKIRSTSFEVGGRNFCDHLYWIPMGSLSRREIGKRSSVW